MSARKTILVLYYTRGVYPLRNTIETHLYCWKRYSKHRTIYVNVAFGFPWEYLKEIPIDAIIFQTSFCGMRWSNRVFWNFTTLVQEISEHPAVKIAIPQDEFIHTDLLCEMVNMFNVDWVLSCAYENEWDNIYHLVDRDRVNFKTVLTGYLDEQTVERIKPMHRALNEREHYISYRAWRAAYWLGSHALHKVKVGEIFKDAALRRGLPVDISLNDSDTIAGDAWFDFLANSRATVGVEGGASILDRDGSYKAAVDAYVAEHPSASFEETRDAVLSDAPDDFTLACISPRHLEAVATKTCQVLIEGGFNDILKAGEHYIPVKPDYSNVEEALDQLADDALVDEMVERAYEEIVVPGRYTYRGFVREIEDEIIDPHTATAPLPVTGRLKSGWMNRRDWLNWRIIQAERAYLDEPERYRPYARFAKPIYRALVDLPDF